MKNAYLSIDLDYWCNHKTTESATQFFRRVMGLKVPITFVIEHEELLPDMAKVAKIQTMYNVDYHSDIIAQYDANTETPADYNWANYIKGRSKARFLWICPSLKTCFHDSSGICHGDEIHNPFTSHRRSGWRQCEVVGSTQLYKAIAWRRVARVGVCLSPLYVNLETVAPVIKMLGVNLKQARRLKKRQPEESDQRKRGTLKEIEK